MANQDLERGIETQEINTVYPVTDVSPPSYEDVYRSGDLTAPPSYNEALSHHHITSAVTSSSAMTDVHPTVVQTEPVVAAVIVENSTSWRPQQPNTNTSWRPQQPNTNTSLRPQQPNTNTSLRPQQPNTNTSWRLQQPNTNTSWRQQQPNTNRQVTATQHTESPDNLRACSIAALILCCPIGIVALIYSIKVDYHLNAGQYESAKMAAKTVGNAAPIGVGLGSAFCLVLIIVIAITIFAVAT
ncbi:uncharacterized protein [Dysidea avara]|uniref:uncharacterized protein n=1 Tax=Dysidea avara TaxID=196820 RepID=UPI0033271CFE